MLFTSTLLNVLVPIAAFVATSSPVDARAGHGSRRSHAAVARRNAKVESRDLYTSAAHQARGENPNPRPARKRSTCSTDSTNSTNSTSVASSSAAPAAATTSSSSSYAAGAASSVVAVASSVVAGAASVVASAASSVINVGANVQTGSATASSSAAAAATSTAAATSQYNSPWTLDHVANGTSFFDSWDVWSYPDPTKGTVDYVDASTAWNEGLIYVKDNGNAVMTVDKTAAVTTGRKSVRLHSKYTLNGGLVIFDAVHMPTGCGTWPAFWSNGPNWPAGGEIDILEGVNVFTENQVSIHTSDGCSIPEDFGATATLTTGNFDNTNCASYATDNQGCGQRSTQANNYGAPFNTNGGGVYAMKWDTTGISVYFFPRESIPDDITAGEPMPSTWGLPQGNFPSTSCDPFTFFKDHTTILDTTFCGDWAGSVWDQAGWAGQSTSCAAQTGYATCSDYVLNNGAAFDQAYWEIKSLKFYVSK